MDNELINSDEADDVDTIDEDAGPDDAAIKDLESVLADNIPSKIRPIILEKTIKLRTGEQLVARIICDSDGVPLFHTTKDKTTHYYQMFAPTIIKTLYFPNNRGNIGSQTFFEEWMSNSVEEFFPINTNLIVCFGTADPAVLNNYNLFTVKNKLYKTHPHIAKHVFEMSFIDTSDNYNVEMTEIEDDRGEDRGYEEGEFS